MQPFPVSPRCLSPFQGNLFSLHCLAFKPRIDSHHGGTWDSPVGKPRGKASRESHRSLDPREGKRDTAATAREESARACPHSRRVLTPLGRLRKYPKIHVSTGEESSGSGTDSTQGLMPGSSPGGSREFEGWTALAWKNLFIYECKIRLGNYSVVRRLSGGRGLNSLVCAEDL